MFSYTSEVFHNLARKIHKRTFLALIYLALGVSILLHLLSYKTPYLHEDESIYYGFSLNLVPDFQSGIIWKAVGRLVYAFNDILALKYVPLFFGISTILIFAVWSRKSIFSILTVFIFSLTPVVFSQFHRFRPEVVHCFLALAAFLCYVKSLEFFKRQKKREFLVLFSTGLLLTLLLIHTHIMAALHYPALILAAVYVSFKTLRRPFAFLISYAIAFLGVFLLFQPMLRAQGVGYLKTISGSQIPTGKIGIFEPINIILLNSRVWFIDVFDSREFFSAGNHLAVLMKFSFVLFFVFFIGALWSSRKRFKDLSPFFIFSVLNVLLFVISIFYFKRLNNSYLLILVIWLFLAGALSSAYTQRWLKCLLVIFTVIPILGIELAHYKKFIFPYRNSLFVENTESIRKMGTQFGCRGYPFVSAPYFPFFNAIDAADLSKLDNSSENIRSNLEGLPQGSCIAIHVRHLWGFEFFSQYKMDALREMLDKNFDVVSASLPMYGMNRAFEFRYKKREGKSFPVGADYVYYDGKEIIYIFKRKIEPWIN